MDFLRMQATIPPNHRLEVQVPDEIPVGPVELIITTNYDKVLEQSLQALRAQSSRQTLKALAEAWRADGRRFGELSSSERRQRVQAAMGSGRGMFSPSDEFAARKRHEIEIEERHFGR